MVGETRNIIRNTGSEWRRIGENEKETCF